MATKSWCEYFEESMESAGQKAPSSLFPSFKDAIDTIYKIYGAYMTFGKSVTVLELIKAGLLAEKFQVLGAVLASYYVGCCLGAAAYATGQYSADNWVDPVYDFFHADETVKGIQELGHRSGVVPPQQGSMSHADNASPGTASRPVNSCNMDKEGKSNSLDFVGWPLSTANSTIRE